MIKIKLPIIALGIAVGFALGATSASADGAQDVADQCNAQGTLDHPDKCDCMGKEAGRDLNEQQQALAVALMAGDVAGAEVLQSGMSADDASAVDQWLTETPVTCANP